jgi:hypothetical protein
MSVAYKSSKFALISHTSQLVQLLQDPPCEATEDISVKNEVDTEAPNVLAPSSQRGVSNQAEFKSSTKVDALLRNLKELREQDPSFRAIVFSQVSPLSFCPSVASRAIDIYMLHFSSPVSWISSKWPWSTMVSKI